MLVEPNDLRRFIAAVRNLLHDPDTGAELGRAAHQRVSAEYLAPRHIERYFRLLTAVC